MKDGKKRKGEEEEREGEGREERRGGGREWTKMERGKQMEESVFRLSVLPTLTELVVCGFGPVVGETKTAPLSISTGPLTQILRLTLPLSPLQRNSLR